MENIDKIIIESLCTAAGMLAEGNRGSECMQELEETILLLELEEDKAAIEGKTAEDLAEVKQQLIKLQNTIFTCHQ